MQNKRHPLTWVLVADRRQAKVFRLVKFPKIEEINYLEHPASRLHDQDLVTSKPGRGSQLSGNIRYSYQQETEPKQQEAIKFASELGKFLSSKKGDFDRLYIIAEPSFLGLLRQNISSEIQKTVVAEIAKELTTSDIATIERHLAEAQP